MSMLANDPADCLLVLNSGAHAQDMSVHFRSPIVRSCNWCNCYNWLWIFLSVGPFPNHHILLDSIYLDFKIFEDSEAPRLVSQIDCRLWLRFKDCGNPICLNSAILCLQLPASEVWELCADRGRRRLFQLSLEFRGTHMWFFSLQGQLHRWMPMKKPQGPTLICLNNMMQLHGASDWNWRWRNRIMIMSLMELIRSDHCCDLRSSEVGQWIGGTHQVWPLAWSLVGLILCTCLVVPSQTSRSHTSQAQAPDGAETLTLKTP